MNPFYKPEIDTTVKLSTDDIINVIHASISRIVDTMEDGERIKMRDLMDKVAADTKIRTTSIEAFVPALANAMPNAHVKKGRTGGLVKGPRVIRVDNRPRCPTCHQVFRGDAKHTEDATNSTSVPEKITTDIDKTDDVYDEIAAEVFGEDDNE